MRYRNNMFRVLVLCGFFFFACEKETPFEPINCARQIYTHQSLADAADGSTAPPLQVFNELGNVWKIKIAITAVKLPGDTYLRFSGYFEGSGFDVSNYGQVRLYTVTDDTTVDITEEGSIDIVNDVSGIPDYSNIDIELSLKVVGTLTSFLMSYPVMYVTPE